MRPIHIVAALTVCLAGLPAGSLSPPTFLPTPAPILVDFQDPGVNPPPEPGPSFGNKCRMRFNSVSLEIECEPNGCTQACMLVSWEDPETGDVLTTCLPCPGSKQYCAGERVEEPDGRVWLRCFTNLCSPTKSCVPKNEQGGNWAHCACQ